MTRLRFTPYLPWHLAELKLRKEQETERPSAIPGDAVTVLRDEHPIAIFGGHFTLPGVFHAWGLVSDAVSDTPKAFHHSVREFAAFFIEKHHIRRLEISVKVGYRAAWKWAVALQFECEGTMKKYGPDGSPYWLFARTR